jgi:hypothetical protein
MALLNKALKASPKHANLRPTFLVDNARTHTSKYTKSMISSMGLTVRYTPPYCPEVAPVEQIFGILKAKIREQTCLEKISLEKGKTAKLIFEIIGGVKLGSLLKPWAVVAKECKRTILEIKQALNKYEVD